MPKFVRRTQPVPSAPRRRRFEPSCTWLRYSFLVATVTATACGLGISALGQSGSTPKSGDPLLLRDAAVSAPNDLNVTLPGGNILREAALLYRAGKLGPALDKYKAVLKASPTSSQAYAGIVCIYLKQGNVDGAAEELNKGLALSDSEDLRVALGEIYFRRGQIPEADREWTNVVNSNSSNGRAYLGLARVRNSLSLNEQSKAMIDKARAMDPIDPDIELEWSNSLPLADRIARLENYLKSLESTHALDRANGQGYLDYMKRLANKAGNCQLVLPRNSAEFPMVRLLADSEHVRGFGIRVSVNDRKANLMLDTGANGILITRQLAEKARLTKMADSRIRAVGDRGESSAYVTIAGSVRIGDLEFRDCPIRVIENRSPVDGEGLIGTDFFEQFLVNLDFPQQKLRLSALPKQRQDFDLRTDAAISVLQDRNVPPEMDSYTRTYRFGSYLLVPTRVGNVRDKLFVLDTGGSQSQITPQAAREITRLRGVPDTTVTGIDGTVKNVYTAENMSLQFGNLPRQSHSLISFDLTPVSNGVGTEISGILGLDLLQSLDIKIDYRDVLVDFQCDPKRQDH